MTRLACLLLAAALTVACGDDDTTGPPVDVTLGETTFVVLLNPIINAATGVAVPAPGTVRSGVEVRWSNGAVVQTDATGVAVLSNVTAGAGALAFAGGGIDGTLNSTIAPRDLHEVAVALTGNGATTMANVRYAFGGTVVDISPTRPVNEVNAELARSNIIVFLRGGTYRGDLRFTGSNVTLFGAGVRGGEVTIDGNVVVEGSGNRIRGARINGDLTIIGSNATLTFSRVMGTFRLSGSGAVLLNNNLCGPFFVTGSNPVVLGNTGMPPLSRAGC